MEDEVKNSYWIYEKIPHNSGSFVIAFICVWLRFFLIRSMDNGANRHGFIVWNWSIFEYGRYETACFFELPYYLGSSAHPSRLALI